MKTAEAKTSSAGVQRKTGPFFQKEGSQDLLPANTDAPFFSNPKNGVSAIQKKLTVGQPDDKYEKEADATADQVIQRLSTPDIHSRKVPSLQSKPLISGITPLVQKKCAACEMEEAVQEKPETSTLLSRKPIFESQSLEEENNVQRKCTECEKEEQVQTKPEQSVASPNIENNLNMQKGGGNPLPASTKLQMEHSFGADFSGVRVHNDSNAVNLSKDLGAQAFTHGSDVYFNSGKYDTVSKQGKHLLAHELTHVVQQGAANSNSMVHRAPETSTAADTGGVDPATMMAETQRDIERDDLGGTATSEAIEAEQDLGGGETTDAPETNTANEVADAELGPQDAELREDTGNETEGSDSVTIPENTPSAVTGGECPTIAPEFPAPPVNATLSENEESFFEELMDLAGSSVMGFSITSIVGGSAYFAWRRLPAWVKVRIINLVIDRIIAGAYWGKLMGPYIGMGNGLMSAMLVGFFSRLRRMPDDQKILLFEKFARIVLKGDIMFTLGLLKGLLIGFFLDGLLSIIQMIIDMICIVPKIIDFFRTIGDFIKKVPYEIQLVIENIKEFLLSIGDTVRNAISELMDIIRHPEKAIALINTIYEAAASQARNLGERVADTFIRYAALPPLALGEIAGRIGGRVLFEGLLIYFSGGVEAAVDVAKVALREIGKMLAKIGRWIFDIIKRLGQIFGFIKNIISKIIKFLTPFLKVVANLARRVIDKIRALFNLFRRMCRPGSIVCKVIKPNCRANRVRRLGFNPAHDAYVTRTTGQSMDYRVRAPFFGVRVPCNFDARLGPARVLVEGKTGYRYLPFIERTNPSLFRFIMFRFNEQRFRCGAIAARCGYAYLWYVQDPNAARFLAFRWHGFPPVLHVP